MEPSTRQGGGAEERFLRQARQAPVVWRGRKRLYLTTAAVWLAGCVAFAWWSWQAWGEPPWVAAILPLVLTMPLVDQAMHADVMEGAASYVKRMEATGGGPGHG